MEVSTAQSNVEQPSIVEILGRESCAQFAAARAPGKVLWCNFELARALGFDVPRSNRMTAEFHEQLLDVFSYRALGRMPKINQDGTINLFADRYGGDGLGPALGAGRSGFLSHGDFYIKGLGITPLFRHDDPNDLAHSHGGLQMNDCMAEAVFGEVNEHLLSRGSTRILAIIDQGQQVVYPHGTVPVAIVVRTGMQLRPGHLLGRRNPRGRSLLELFTRMTRATGQLVTTRDPATGRDLVNIKATMLRIVDDHAQTAAQLFRWRMLHGAVTSSNMCLNGAMMDLTTQTAQPRTAPVCFALEDESFYGREHIDCARQLCVTYRALVKSLPQRLRQRLNAKRLNLTKVMQDGYDEHLQLELLGAIGLKMAVAHRINDEHAELSQRFKDIVTAMCELRNPGNVEMARRLVETVSVLDVFSLLRRFPETYFWDPEASHFREIRASLGPVFRGNPRQIAKKRNAVKSLIGRFDRIYSELIKTADSYAREYYGRRDLMRASIRSRAAFENEPISLYRTLLYKEFDEAIEAYKSTGNSEIIRCLIDEKITTSQRKTDALLAQGNRRRLSDTVLELEIVTIDGVRYSVRACNDRIQRRSLHVGVRVKVTGNVFETGLPGWPRLSMRQVGALRYRFTTNDWVRSRVATSRLTRDCDGGLFICWEITSGLPVIGRLEGVFYMEKGGPLPDFRGAGGYRGAVYTFAVPDKEEFGRLAGMAPG